MSLGDRITQLIQAQAAPYAQAALERGQAYGRMFENLGQIGAKLPEQIQQAREFQRQKQARQTLAQAIGANTDPQTGEVNHEKVASTVGAAGFPEQAQAWLHTSATAAEDLGKLQAMKEGRAEKTQARIGDLAFAADTPEKFNASLGILATSGLVPHDQVMQFAAQADASPEAWQQIRAKFLPFSPQYQEQQKEGRKVIELRPGGMATTVGNVQAQGGTITAPTAPKSKTETDLALDAADANSPTRQQSIDAIARLKPIAPESTQVHDKLLDGRPATLTWEPKTKQWLDAEGKAIQNAATRVRPIPLASETVKPIDQNKLEQEYRTVLQRGLSSRSGGLGLEDAKVQQANHLLSLLDQTYDVRTGQYNIPKVLQSELAAGLARLVAPGGQVGIEMMREFDQRSARGDLAGAFSYVTGHPFPTATQDIATMLKDSIERQGKVALENREGEMRYLRGLVPTDLSEDRRTKLEKNSLNPLRQSVIVTNPRTGERKIKTSIDGGETWR